MNIGKSRNKNLVKHNNTKQKILNVSLQLFAKKGYNGVTTKEIAKKCKISEGLIFHYFSKKSDILYHIFEQLEQELSAQMENILLQTEINSVKDLPKKEKYKKLEELLKKIAYLVYRNFTKKEYNLFFRVVLNSMMVLDKKTKTRIINKIHQTLWIPVSLKIKEYLSEDIDEYLFFRLFQSSISGFLIFQKFFEWENIKKIDYECYIHFTIDCIINGIKQYEKSNNQI